MLFAVTRTVRISRKPWTTCGQPSRNARPAAERWCGWFCIARETGQDVLQAAALSKAALAVDRITASHVRARDEWLAGMAHIIRPMASGSACQTMQDLPAHEPRQARLQPVRLRGQPSFGLYTREGYRPSPPRQLGAQQIGQVRRGAGVGLHAFGDQCAAQFRGLECPAKLGVPTVDD